jgi:hypothetical protein
MRFVIFVLSLGVATATAQVPSPHRQHAGQPDAAIDERAMSRLSKMSDVLRTLKTFRITSESTKDEIVDTNMKIQKNASGVMSVRLPDRLHARVQGDDDRRFDFYYNGQTLTVAGRDNYYATTTAPPTVARMLDATRARHGIELPLADFLHMAAGEDFRQSISGAGYIGTSLISGVECDHLAIRQADVDWQVWIERGATPLPRKLVITTKTEPTQPQYTAVLAWDLSPAFEDSLFTFTPGPNAIRIMFARVKPGEPAATTLDRDR